MTRRYTPHNKGNKMTKEKFKKHPDPKVYQSALDPDQRGYINAAIYAALQEQQQQFQSEINNLRAHVVRLTNENERIDNELKIVKAYYEADDRYVLTRAKIIHFLKKQGIE